MQFLIPEDHGFILPITVVQDKPIWEIVKNFLATVKYLPLNWLFIKGKLKTPEPLKSNVQMH